MRLLVISDSHGRIDRSIDAYKSIEAIDIVIHLGDHARDAAALAKRIPVPVLSVRGNCDGDRSENGYRILDTEYGSLFIAHGHMEGVKNGLERLIQKAGALGCRGALFGHTHRPLLLDLDGFYLLNPGSITYPGPGGKPSFAVVKTGEDSFEASIHYL